MKKLMVVALAALAGAAGATDYTWTGQGDRKTWANATNWSPMTGYPTAADDNAIFTDDATVQIVESGNTVIDTITIAAGKTLTLATTDGSKIRTLQAKAITGGTLAMNRAYLAARYDADLVISSTLKVLPVASGENRLLKAVNADKQPHSLTVNGNLEGKGAVRLLYTFQTGSIYTSGGYVEFGGDNSDFAGTMIVDGSQYTRMRFLSPASANMPKATIINNNNQTASIAVVRKNDQDGTTMSLGAIRDTDKDGNKIYLSDGQYYQRFGSTRATLEVGGLNAEDDFIGSSIGLRTATSFEDFVALRKIGTGTLEVYDVRHNQGTEIQGGTLLVSHPAALAGSARDENGYPTGVSPTATITFTGGTLKYGTDPKTGQDVTTDYSANIRNSTAPIAIDTNGKDIVWTGALDASNTEGLVKKGEGTLTLKDNDPYEGTLTSEAGTLKITYTTDTAAMPEVKVKTLPGAGRLEVTLRNTGKSRPTIDLTDKFAEGTIVNIVNDVAGTMPRFTAITGFRGTLNFLDTHDNMTGAGGFVGDKDTTYGSADIDFGILGNPSSPAQVFDFSANLEGAFFVMGSLQLPSPNAIVYSKNWANVTLGGTGHDSYLNGTFKLRDDVNGTAHKHLLSLTHVGTGTLTLGKDFKVTRKSDGATPLGEDAPTIAMTAGALENQADLSGIKLTLAAGTLLKGDFSTADAAAFTNYTVELPAKETLDKSKVYDLVKVPAGAAAPTVDLTALNDGETKGRWKVSKNADGVYQLSWRPNGLAIIIM